MFAEFSLAPSRTVAEAIPAAFDPRKTAEQLLKDQRQKEFWEERLHFKSSIAARLRSVGRIVEADKLDHCRSEAFVRKCLGCSKSTMFWNRCDLVWCPACAARLSRKKKESVEAWTQYIGQPKHVVLTVRNSGTLTKEYVLWFKSCFARLRRTKFANQHTEEVYACDIATRREMRRYSYKWIGGFYSLEVTKERNGWHLHLHALVQSKFIDSVMLAAQWAKIIGQDVAIVKVKDARGGEYLQELLKYVVKGDTMSQWTGEEIATFIDAFNGPRTFGVFGTLYKRRAEFKAMLEEYDLRDDSCECGCTRYEILTLKEHEWNLQVGQIPPPHRPVQRVVQPVPELFSFSTSDHLAALAR